MSELFQEPVLLTDTEVVQKMIEQVDQYGEPITVSRELVIAILQKLEELSERQALHTLAVNQFGVMLDHVVQSVTGFSQMMQSQGIGGLLKMMGGTKND